MQIILSDHNCEGHANTIFEALKIHGFFPTFAMKLITFEQAGLHPKASDREVWNFCQERGYLLLTGNRTADDGTKSLEHVIHAFVKADSLPVITIGNLRRVMADPDYCFQCAENLAEIVLDLDELRGTTRLYIPVRAVGR